jgi:hypothetical protein
MRSLLILIQLTRDNLSFLLANPYLIRMWPVAWPWALALLATNVPAPGVGDVGHNISPRLLKQLVLELKVRVCRSEILQELPRCIFVPKSVPLDKDLPDIASFACVESSFGRRQYTPVLDQWQSTRRLRGITTVGLQQPHMEDVMKA